MYKQITKQTVVGTAFVLLVSIQAYAGGGGGGGGSTNSPSGSPSGNAQISNSSNGSSSASGVGGVNLGATILSYEAQERIGEAIAGKISNMRIGKDSKIKQVFITTDLQNVGGALIQYQGTLQQLKQLHQKFATTIKEATNILIQEFPPAPTNLVASTESTPLFSLPITAADAINAFNTLVGFVSTTTTLNGVSVTPDEMGVIPVIAESLNQVKICATYVNLFVDTSYVNNSGTLLFELNRDLALKAKAQIIINMIGAIVQSMPPLASNPPAVTSPTLPTRTTAPTQPDTKFNHLPIKLQNDYLELSALSGQLDNLAASLSASNIMSSLLAADFYENNVRGKPTNGLLYIKLLYASGDDRIKSNPFVNLFTDGPRYSYAGGAVVVYMLVNYEGKTVVSGVARDLTGYQKINTDHSSLFFTKKIKGNLPSGTKLKP